MLMRQHIRQYLKILLWSEEIPQTADCEVGALLDNCDNKARGIFVQTNSQIVSDADGEWRADGTKNAVVIEISNVTHTGILSTLCDSKISFNIHVYSCEKDANRRQDSLDIIEERIWHRLYSYATLTNAITGEKLKPIFKRADHNTFNVNISEETDFDGDFTVRTLNFTFDYKECISKSDCLDTELCFDFSDLTGLEDCNAGNPRLYD